MVKYTQYSVSCNFGKNNDNEVNQKACSLKFLIVNIL